eukprot:SAG22_NODE_1514_length_4253_cov_1.546943_3_plen_103_part_00
MLDAVRAGQGGERAPLIPLRPPGDGDERGGGKPGTGQPTLLDEVAELAGVTTRQLFWASAAGIVIKLLAVVGLYLAYKHHLGPFGGAAASGAPQPPPAPPLY